MNKIWFTSDHHFGHKRIIELCRRPFASLAEMDNEMARRWNECVQPGDTVYHLGDFSFASQAIYLPSLNGHKHLIVGNHDPKRLGTGVGEWLQIHPPYLEINVGRDHIVLCHYALRVWNRSHHGAIHLYGHSHGNLPGDSQSCDVGVDCWDFRPVTLDEIKARLATSGPLRIEPDHHQKQQ